MANDLGGGGGYKKPKPKAVPPARQKAERLEYQRHVGNLKNQARDAYMQNLQGGQNFWSNLLNRTMAPFRSLPTGSGGRGGGYGGYRGGGGGYVDPYAALRKQLESSLNTQRDAARAALPKYLSEYNTAIAGIGKNNRAVTDKYSAEIQALMQQLIAQAQGAVDRLSGDLTAQGAGLAPLKAQADQALLGIRNTGTAQDVYNKRLAQMMAAAEADRLAAGASVNQAAQAQLDNAYMQALARIQGMR